MQRWILIGGGVIVVLLLAMLLMEVRAKPETEVDADKLERARIANRRVRAAAPAPVEAAPPDLSWRTSAEAEARDEDSQPPARVSKDDSPPPRDYRHAATAPTPEMRPLRVRPPRGDDAPPQQMDAANRLYDRADYEGAGEAAKQVLAADPGNTRMLRIVVSSACIMGEASEAADYYGRLERDRDRRHMRSRCGRYGIELPE